jgi:hypothetical protein
MERIEINKILCSTAPIKEEDTQLFAKLKKSLQARGQLKNIVVCEIEDGMFECLEGSKIVKALKEMQEETVFALNLGNLSDFEKNLIRIEVSRDYFLTNYVQIGLYLKRLAEEVRVDELCNTLPFTMRQCHHLMNMSEFDWEQFNLSKQTEGQTSIFDIFDDEEKQSSVHDFCDTKVKDEVESSEKTVLEFNEQHLQTWQKTVLEITSHEENSVFLEKTIPQNFNEQTDPLFQLLDTKDDQIVNTENNNEAIEIVFDLNFDVDPKQNDENKSNQKTESNSFKKNIGNNEKEKIETTEHQQPSGSQTKVEPEELKYTIISNELVIYKDSTAIIGFLPFAAKKYLQHKYDNKTIEDVKIDFRLEDDITYVRTIQLKADYGVTFNLKPEKWIEYLIDEIDPIDNPFQQSLF